jgi:hypothetical protein
MWRQRSAAKGVAWAGGGARALKKWKIHQHQKAEMVWLAAK